MSTGSIPRMTKFSVQLKYYLIFANKKLQIEKEDAQTMEGKYMIARLKRYLIFGLQYFLWEKPRGLDFTMRDISLLRNSNGLYHGYSKTAEKHLQEIFNSLNFTGKERLLDIGCGKGVVLRIAAGYPFEKVTGIEIDERLVAIAANNFRVLKMEDRVQCICANAAEFESYGNYNTFFMFNPFSSTIMKKVADKLLEVSEKNPVTVIYHNPVYMEFFEKEGKVTVLKQLYDKTKDYNTCIFRMSGWKR